MNKLIFNSEIINNGLEKELVEIKFSNELNQLRRLNLGKLIQMFRIMRDLYSSIKKFRPDGIYFTLMPVGKGLWRDLVFVLIIKRTKTRVIYHLHNRGIAGNSGRPFMKSLYRYIFRNSCVIHLSERLMKEEIDILNVQDLHKYVVPNGIKVKNPKAEKENEMVNLLYLSNLFPQKGVIDMVEIFSSLRSSHQNVQLTIAGGFPYRSTYKRLVKRIKELGLESEISIVGPKYGKHKTKEFQKAHMFIFPTSFRQECFPLVILEAMNFGLPVVASSEGAIPEIIDNNINGFVVELEDRERFIESIERLIRDRQLRHQIGLKARQKFMDNYTIEIAEARIRDIFEKEIMS